ncbi:hypothetical protein [Streptomyces mexicanus]|uniref:hypothetical protein n=1 Tax=Streptomyces mexicanus TaxID=178566 RepID=UPI001F2963F5|nr:hypothetical protein [Streptomyces mexicanus]
MWLAGAVLAVVLALTAYLALSGDDDGHSSAGKGGAHPSASGSVTPGPTYTEPDDWIEPDRWSALPRGEHTDRYGNQVVYPHTTEGAVAMLAAANSTDVEGGRTLRDEQLANYHSYVARADQTAQNAENVELASIDADKQMHQSMGLPAGSDLPSGAYVRNTVIAYKVIKASRDEVSVWLLAKITKKAGETQKETASYTRTLMAGVWQDGDWKMSSAALVRASQQTDGQPKPEMAAPGDAKFNEVGWVAIREAS